MKRFTLIELLVVIAVLGILVTILLPSMQKTRKYASVAVCASNIKQNSFGISAYSKTNNYHLPPKSSFTDPQYNRYFARITFGIEKYSILGKVWNTKHLSSSETIFCPQVNQDANGTLRSHDYYLVNGQFNPFEALKINNKKAGRSSYIFYPYLKSDTEWKSLTLAQLESDQMWLSDNLWNSQHGGIGVPGWNVSKVDLSIKFVKSKSAFTYIETNSNIWSDWSKCDIVRDTLLTNL